MHQILAFILLLLLFPLSTVADPSFANRKDVQAFVNETAKQYHLDKKQLHSIMNQVVIQPQIIESMEKPFEKKNWDVYQALFLTPQRLEAGLNFWRTHQEVLSQVEKRFKVPAEIIVAILGVETLYGTRQGEYRVLDALATLSFHYPKRAPYFTYELKEYLALCQEQKTKATQYLGSYAGAIGQPQFMPSSYRHYGVDFNHNGSIDLVNDSQDAIASIANYFYKFGWRANEMVAEQAKVHGHRYKKLALNPKSANYTYWKLRTSGIQPLNAAKARPKQVGVIELTTEKGNDYWMAYPNFFVITRYNSSPQYALVVHLFSQELKKAWNKNPSRI